MPDYKYERRAGQQVGRLRSTNWQDENGHPSGCPFPLFCFWSAGDERLGLGCRNRRSRGWCAAPAAAARSWPPTSPAIRAARPAFMPAVAGDSRPVGKVPILKPSASACFCDGVARGAPGDSTTNDGRPLAAAMARPISASSAGELRNSMSAPSSTYISMRATASSMPCVGRQSVRASTRMPELPGRLDGGADFHARLGPRQAGLAGGGERARRDLVLDQHRGGAGAAIGAHRALHVHGVAVAVVAVGQDEQLGCRAMHHLEGIEHLAENQEVENRGRPGDSPRRRSRTGRQS